MSDYVPTHASVDNVEADPKKPWKAIVAALVTALAAALGTYFTGRNEWDLNGVLYTLGSALLSFALTYLVKNPKVITSGGDL
jgi:hypothetical protein